jgi:hypothetical protein
VNIKWPQATFFYENIKIKIQFILPDPLANNFGGIDEIVQNGIVDSLRKKRDDENCTDKLLTQGKPRFPALFAL